MNGRDALGVGLVFLTASLCCLLDGERSAVAQSQAGQTLEQASQAEQDILRAIDRTTETERRTVIFKDSLETDPNKSRFLMEAENFSSRRSSSLSGGWWEVDGKQGTFVEGPNKTQPASTVVRHAEKNYMEALGKPIGDVAPTSPYYPGPYLDYQVRIENAGDYRLYLRWCGRDDATDSVYAYVLKPDGTRLTHAGPGYFMFHGRTGSWVWDDLGLTDRISCGFAGRNAAAVWTIPEPGVYTIRLALREAGSAVDTLLFQSSDLRPPFEVRPERLILRGAEWRSVPPIHHGRRL